MNIIFAVITLASALAMLIISPADFLPAMLDGGLNAAKCALTLFTIYVVWMGLSAVAEDAKLTRHAARLLSPVCRKVFKTDDEEATEAISMNLCCNLLGIGGAATPYAVKAVERLEKNKNAFAQDLLFVINGTSIQLIPSTVIALRAATNSVAAYDIVLPSLIATAISTLSGVAIYLMFNRLKGARLRKKCSI